MASEATGTRGDAYVLISVNGPLRCGRRALKNRPSELSVRPNAWNSSRACDTGSVMRYRVTYWVLARPPCENKRRLMSSGVATHRWPHCKPSSLKFSGMWSNRCHSLYSRCRPSSTSVNEKNPTLTLWGTRGRYSGKAPEVGDGVDVVGLAAARPGEI